MSTILPNNGIEYWNYVEYGNSGAIHNINNKDIIFSPHPCELFKLKKQEFIRYVNQLLNIFYNTICYNNKICIVYYIYYITYNYNNILQSKDWSNWKNVLVDRLKYFIKKEYYEDRTLSYEDMKIFKQIYYLYTNTHICEEINCYRDCCNKTNTLCSVHIRKRNKKAKQLQLLTNIPLDICKLITEY